MSTNTTARDAQQHGEIPGITRRRISHAEAREIATRLINSHFRKEPCARVGIPARPDYDDDLLINAYILQQEAAALTQPSREGEARPFAWFKTDVNGRPAEFTGSATGAEAWAEQGFIVTPVYTAPPGTDVAEELRADVTGALKDCRWDTGQPFMVQDTLDPHGPCYVVTPDGLMIPFNSSAEEGVDVARANFVAHACNATIALLATPSDAAPDAVGETLTTHGEIIFGATRLDAGTYEVRRVSPAALSEPEF